MKARLGRGRARADACLRPFAVLDRLTRTRSISVVHEATRASLAGAAEVPPCSHAAWLRGLGGRRHERGSACATQSRSTLVTIDNASSQRPQPGGRKAEAHAVAIPGALCLRQPARGTVLQGSLQVALPPPNDARPPAGTMNNRCLLHRHATSPVLGACPRQSRAVLLLGPQRHRWDRSASTETCYTLSSSCHARWVAVLSIEDLSVDHRGALRSGCVRCALLQRLSCSAGHVRRHIACGGTARSQARRVCRVSAGEGARPCKAVGLARARAARSVARSAGQEDWACGLVGCSAQALPAWPLLGGRSAPHHLTRAEARAARAAAASRCLPAGSQWPGCLGRPSSTKWGPPFR